MSQHTTDRELLELAARAFGLSVHTWLDYSDDLRPDVRGSAIIERDDVLAFWNPLKDDGDALRLAVKLGILFLIDVQCGKVVKKTVVTDGKTKHEVNHDGDPYAATRRAIVLAAAEIGRSAGGAV